MREPLGLGSGYVSQMIKQMARVNIGAVDLSDRAAAWLRVAANINGESMRVRVAKALDGHLKRFKPAYAADIRFLARQYQVSWEVMFVLLNQHEPPFSEDEIAWAKEQPAMVVWEEEQTQFGVELQERPLTDQRTELEDEPGSEPKSSRKSRKA